MIKLARPNIPPEALEKIITVIKSGNLVQGRYVEEFENRLKTYLGARNAIVVSSGTAALHLSLLALGIKAGDEVIVPAFTFPATANVVEMVGAKPILVDISLKDCCIDTLKIEAKISSRTKLILPVHEFGQAARMDALMALTQKYNLRIIEDAACALGAEFNSKRAGTFGDLGCFSFHPRKAITTGEGGAVVTDNDELAQKIAALRNHGIQNINGKMSFEFAGLNYRMTDFQAVLGLTQLDYLNRDIAKRIEVADYYDLKLSEFEWIETPVTITDRKMVYQTYHILIQENLNRDALLAHLKENGIEANYGAQALNCLNFYQNKYALTAESHPNATSAFYHGVALPIGMHIDKAQIDKIHSALLQWNNHVI